MVVNSYVLSMPLKIVSDDEDVTCDGRLFQTRAAVTGNVSPLSVDLWNRGTAR